MEFDKGMCFSSISTPMIIIQIQSSLGIKQFHFPWYTYSTTNGPVKSVQPHSENPSNSWQGRQILQLSGFGTVNQSVQTPLHLNH